MPARGRSQLGSKAEAGCAKCCAYCRIDPLASAVCYGAIALAVVSFILYLTGAVLAAPAEGSAPAPCAIPNTTVLGDNVDTIYRNYLNYTGIVVICAMMGLMCCCGVSCGLCCKCPRIIKIVAAIAIIPSALCLGLYLTWTALGTYLLVLGNSAYSYSICRNVLVYLIFLYIYLVCGAIFWIIVFIWKMNSVRSSLTGGSSTSSKKNLISMDSMPL